MSRETLQDLRDKLDRVKGRYSAKLERMAGLATTLPEPFKTQFWNIYANGTADPAENPTYQQRMNILAHQRDGLATALRLVLNVADTAASVLRTISPDEAKRFRNDSKIIRAALAKLDGGK